MYHSAIQRHLEESFDLPPVADMFDFVPQPGQDRGLPALLQTKSWVAYLLYSLDVRTYEPGIEMLSTAGVFPQRRISACLKSSRIPEDFPTEFLSDVSSAIKTIDRTTFGQLKHLMSS